jgi:DNA-binding MarR family transcriptional regulator
MTLARNNTNTAATAAMVEFVSQSFRLNSRLQLTADRMARDVGLSAARWQMLSVVGQATKPLTISDIARSMGLARQSVQRVADALSEEGLISYQPNPKHQRASLVTMTKQAATLLEQLDNRRIAWAREVADTLQVADIKAANAVLQAISEKLYD